MSEPEVVKSLFLLRMNVPGKYRRKWPLFGTSNACNDAFDSNHLSTSFLDAHPRSSPVLRRYAFGLWRCNLGVASNLKRCQRRHGIPESELAMVVAWPGPCQLLFVELLSLSQGFTTIDYLLSNLCTSEPQVSHMWVMSEPWVNHKLATSE